MHECAKVEQSFLHWCVSVCLRTVRQIQTDEPRVYVYEPVYRENLWYIIQIISCNCNETGSSKQQRGVQKFERRKKYVLPQFFSSFFPLCSLFLLPSSGKIWGSVLLAYDHFTFFDRFTFFVSRRTFQNFVNSDYVIGDGCECLYSTPLYSLYMNENFRKSREKLYAQLTIRCAYNFNYSCTSSYFLFNFNFHEIMPWKNCEFTKKKETEQRLFSCLNFIILFTELFRSSSSSVRALIFVFDHFLSLSLLSLLFIYLFVSLLLLLVQ